MNATAFEAQCQLSPQSRRCGGAGSGRRGASGIRDGNGNTLSDPLGENAAMPYIQGTDGFNPNEPAVPG
jgi:hypothetical protein